MERKSFGDMKCPIARSLERVGEWWNILILREAFYGFTRFDEFQKNLGIAPNILTRRLKGLVESGLLDRRAYSGRPPRFEYVLTDIGHDFRPIVLSFLAWGNKHFAPEGESIVLKHMKTGKIVVPVLVDKVSGEEITASTNFEVMAGPAADDILRKKLAECDALFSGQKNKII